MAGLVYDPDKDKGIEKDLQQLSKQLYALQMVDELQSFVIHGKDRHGTRLDEFSNLYKKGAELSEIAKSAESNYPKILGWSLKVAKDRGLYIDEIERLKIRAPFYHAVWPSVKPPQLTSENEREEPILLKILDYISRGVSILSGIAVIVFIVLLWSGQTHIGSVQIGTLLTILSFTLVGGLISIGGVKMFSINANLRKTKDRIERVTTTAVGCPFLPIFAEQSTELELRRPGNPYVCIKCPLGVDISPGIEGGLINTCSVYSSLHNQWKELPGAEGFLDRRAL